MNPVDRYLPFGLTLDTLVVYMVGLVTFLCIVVAWRALIDDDSRLARQRIIARRRDELRLVALVQLQATCCASDGRRGQR